MTRDEAWSQFTAAVESAINGDPGPARELVAAYPVVREELRRFYQARKDGRIVIEGGRYRNVKTGG